MLDALKIAKKPETVMLEIANAILDGRIEGGRELTQNELAESLAVSRMPVREALTVLEELGLVERLHNQHIKVTCIDQSFFNDIFALLAAVLTRTFAAMQNDEQTACAEALRTSEEAYFHKLQAYVQNPLHRHIIKRFATVYIPFALSSATHNATAGSEHLQNAQFSDYFMQLAADAWNRRNA